MYNVESSTTLTLWLEMKLERTHEDRKAHRKHATTSVKTVAGYLTPLPQASSVVEMGL